MTDITRRQAREYVRGRVIRELESHVANGSEWLYPEGLSESGQNLLLEQLAVLICELQDSVQSDRAQLKELKQLVFR